MENKIKTITVPPKYQVVIPKEIRDGLKLKPGQKLQVIQTEDRVEYIILKNNQNLNLNFKLRKLNNN